MPADINTANIPSRNGEVQLWFIPLEIAEHNLLTLERTLLPDEIERANRFRFAETRRRFVVRRAALRQILGQLLSLCPEEIRFERTEYGKPFLTNEIINGTLHLSLSNSDELAIVALSLTSEIGVDIEFMQPFPEMFTIAERYFCSTEVSQLKELAIQGQAREFFYRCWCKKEAFLKARGYGLVGIDKALSEPSILADTYFHEFTPADGFAGAFCTSFRPAEISEFVFRHEAHC